MAINLYNMGTIERTRVIRPSSRKDKSTYKVDIERRQEKDRRSAKTNTTA